MKRTTAISSHEKSQQQQQQQTTEAPDVKSKTAIVASLPIDRSRPVHPYSSLSLSPNGQYALVAGKDTIQLVTVGPNGLETLKSFNIAHHFYPTSSPASNETRQQQHKYGDVRDAFQQQTSGVTNMNLNQQYGNIIVTKVAWSNNYNCPPRQRQHPQRNISDISDTGIDESLPTSNTETKEGGKQQKGRIRRRKKRRGKKETDVDNNYYVGNGNDHDLETMAESFVAAAGSNGVVVVWRAKRLLFSDYGETKIKSKSGRFTIASSSSSSSSSAAHLAKQQRTQQPEGILSQHTRAVNGLAWHPTISGLLLTASQDATIKLWERRAVVKHSRLDGQTDRSLQEEQEQQQQQQSWFSTMVGGVVGSGYKNASLLDPAADDDEEENKYSWRCKATYSVGEQDAVRDISWNKLLPDIFGAVTASGNLVVYNMHVSFKALVKIAAHTGFASSLDFHPQRPFVVATGGSADRSVKIWNLESSLEYFVNNCNRNRTHHQHNMHDNASTWNTAKSDVSNNSTSSSESQANTIRGTASGWSMGGKYTKSTTSAFPKHVLSISASVTKVRWRPPSNEFLPLLSDSINNSTSHDRDDKKQEVMVDRHDSMLAVATARLTSAGGSGALSLWSYNRPYMSLSIVEGHEEGAIEDFVWLKTPKTIPKPQTEILQQNFTVRSDTPDSPSLRLRNNSESPTIMDDSSLGVKERTQKDDEQAGESSPVSFIWQNVLSVGRDGQCIMQSFARGERRIRSVPSSCFAMANFSPFQPGSGSLQCFSVYQDVPNCANDDFMLTALRQDEYTAKAPGVFREDDIQNHTAEKDKKMQDGGKVFPSSVPQLSFSVVDQGSLSTNGMPIVNEKDALFVAPEVVHLSRFARLYKLYPDASCPSRVDLCIYNSKVAEELRCGPLARMWKTVSSLLRGSGLEELPSKTPTEPTNVFQFVIFPTIKSLLLERAEAGDVQTNVALCEVLQVIDSGGEQTRIPSLGMKLVREWYLSYIDLLHHMCLFSAAALLIKNCQDKAIGGLSQQSTTIHESCPRCCRPIESSTGSSDNANGRQVCKNCRRRVGMCFLCHEPVTGMFVWCPGCGHGGHMEHALQWFGGSNGKPIRTVCPTGCGHRCNFVQMATAFPRTMSMTFSDTSSADQCKFITAGS